MTDKPYVAAIDQGTTSTRFVVFDRSGSVVAGHQLEHKQIYPEPGFVEHDPLEIKSNTASVIAETLKKKEIKANRIAAIGITNQRETTVLWNKHTGKPVYNAIVWQDTRTDSMCKKLVSEGHESLIRQKTGLPVASYFSGTKIRWILDNVEGAATAAADGDLLFGNMDTWLLWWLTGGPEGGVHVTDVTNASRTMLMNLETLEWDEELLGILGIPKTILPSIRSSSELYGHIAENWGPGKGIPVAGDLGDQQAALFGQVCFETGEAKNTYGTGCFLLSNTGDKIVRSKYGLLTTLAYRIGEEPAVYAVEGSIAIAGSLVQWLRDNMGIIGGSSEIEALASSVDDNGGVYFVPAFSGLFAPRWDSSARGLIIGMTHYITKAHIARAALEATAFQANEIFEAIEKDSGIPQKILKVDGGMAKNNLLMQFQADLLRIPVARPAIIESTVLGASYAAGLAVGFWRTKDDLKSQWKKDIQWNPAMPKETRDRLCADWDRAVERSIGWIKQ